MYNDHEVTVSTVFGIMQGHQYPVMVRFWNVIEPLHAYLVALVASLPGQELGFYTLKLTAALASLATLPLVFWAGMEMTGGRKREFRLAIALMMMGLVAVSYWHNVITRGSVRVHLLLPFAALTLVFLARAMRVNRRSDYICLGLALGFGFYSYTPARLLPLLVICGTLLAIVLRPISWRERPALCRQPERLRIHHCHALSADAPCLAGFPALVLWQQ